MSASKGDHDDNELFRVKFIHEPVHERLVNWGRWLNPSGGGSSAAPMFRGYKAPRYRDAYEEVRVPVDGIDAARVEKVVGLMPELHRDAIRWYYVYSHRGIDVWRAQRALCVQRDSLARLVHDGRAMVKNRLDSSGSGGRIPSKFDPAPAVPASPSEAGVSVKQTEQPA